VVVSDKIGPGVAGGVKYVIEGIRCKPDLSTFHRFQQNYFWGSLRPGALRTEICCLTSNMFPYWFHTKNKA